MGLKRAHSTKSMPDTNATLTTQQMTARYSSSFLLLIYLQHRQTIAFIIFLQRLEPAKQVLNDIVSQFIDKLTTPRIMDVTSNGNSDKMTDLLIPNGRTMVKRHFYDLEEPST
jgi:hypothetical protein